MTISLFSSHYFDLAVTSMALILSRSTINMLLCRSLDICLCIDPNFIPYIYFTNSSSELENGRASDKKYSSS